MAMKRSPSLGKPSDPRVRAALFYARKRRLNRLRGGGSGPAPDPVEESGFNPADKSANILISDGGRTISRNSGYGISGVRSLNSHSTGRFYFEAVLNQIADDIIIGLAPASLGLNGDRPGFNNFSWGMVKGGTLYSNFPSGAIVFSGAAVAGDRLGIVHDHDLKKVWVRKNNSDWNLGGPAGPHDPETGAGGYSLPSTVSGELYVFVCITIQLDSLTFAFSEDDFVDDLPANVKPWNFGD